MINVTPRTLKIFPLFQNQKYCNIQLTRILYEVIVESTSLARAS